METEKDSKIIQEANKTLTLLDFILVFLKYKKTIIIFTSIVFVVSVILYFFVFDLIYLSSASVKSSSKSSGLLTSIEGLSGLSGLSDVGLGGGTSAREIASYEDILVSRRCLEPLIIKFGLMERDGYKYMEDAVKSFSKDQLVLSEDKLAGILYIGVYDKDPKLAKEMVEFLLSELDNVNIGLNVLNAKNNREFIERRYVQTKEDLSKAEDSLKAFQIIYGVAPDLQIKAAAQSAFTLEAELKTEEVKLEVLRKILSPDQVEIKTQEAKINALRDQLSQIQNSTNTQDFLRLGNSPQIAMSFLRLEREVEIQTKILTFLLPLYEQAKIEEKKETPTILILDNPYIAERKTKPKRATMVVVWTFLGFTLSSVGFVLYEKLKMLRSRIRIMK